MTGSEERKPHGLDRSQRPAATRRSVLVGTASGMAASVAAMTVAGPAPARAATASGPTDWINVVSDYGADPGGGTDSTAAIQNALYAAAPGRVVYLPAGVYQTTAPLSVPPFVHLLGSRQVQAAADVQNQNASVLQPAKTWKPQPSMPGGVAGTIVLLDSQAQAALTGSGWPAAYGGANPGAVIENVLIDGSMLGPAVADGITAFGSIGATRITGVGMNKITGNGMNGMLNPSSTAADKSPDGWHVSHCILQDITGYGAGSVIGAAGTGLFMDSTWIDVHAQGCGGDGFVIASMNCRMIGCRADYCANGFTVNAFAASGGDSSVSLSCCGTEANAQSGLNVINSSATGTSGRAPVLVTGCSFEGDGTSGGYSGIAVAGANRVLISATNVLISTAHVPGGCPAYALSTAKSGSSGGVPGLVQATGGFWNAATALVIDAAPAYLMSYSVHGYGGGTYSSPGKTPPARAQKNPL
jgi:hypothetical protein